MRATAIIALALLAGCVGRTNETIVVQDKLIPCITQPADRTCTERDPGTIAEYREDLALCRAEVGYWRAAWEKPKWCKR